VNLATGATTNGLLVTTDVGTILDFTGGFAVSPGVPEPASVVLALLGIVGLALLRRRVR
jgi:PEP-CTERM motif